MQTILILGGYGETGRALTRHLLAQTGADLIIAGRHPEEAQAFVDSLQNPRLSAVQVDAGEQHTLESALAGTDLCLVASPTTDYVGTVARACIQARVDYLDVQFSAAKLCVLFDLREEIQNAGLCFVTEAGYHPGLPAVMVRYAASQMDLIEEAIVAGYLNIGPGTPYTEAVDELMEAFQDYNAQVFRHGKWTRPGQWEMARFDFGRNIGWRNCYSMFFEELRLLPEMHPSIKDMGFYISGSNWLADWIITPIVMAGLKIAPKRGLGPLGKLMWWGMQRSRPPYQVMISMNSKGRKTNAPVRVCLSISHPDGYELTAIPVVAYLKQYLDGTARYPGLHMMGHIADPVRLISDMQAMGAQTSIDQY